MTLLDGFTFTDAEVPVDAAPVTDSVEYPCTVCNKEAGPYSGRGRKPTKCAEHRKSTSGVKVSGSTHNLAAQAAKSLVQMNSLLALGTSAFGFFRTGGAIAEYQETFEAQAYAALVTDKKLCETILRAGSKSAGVALAIAYGGQALAVGPVLYAEMKERKASQEVHMDES